MTKLNDGKRSAIAFDPLDLGFKVEDADVPRRGRPKSPLLDRTRAAYWAWTVQKAAGKSFAELEREMASVAFPRRDGGGFEQPCAWLKYASGQRCPLPPSKGDKSTVVRAESRYPGTRTAYDSITWDLMYDAKSQPTNRLKLTSRISPYVLNLINPDHIEERDQYRILLTPKGVADLVLVRHLDAFGIILMQWRNGDWTRADVSLIHLARTWLLFSFQMMETFVTCRQIFARLIHRNVRELGLLNGPCGLDPKKTPNERMRDAFFSALLGGVVVSVPHVE